ncbi:hypothetical protein ABPG74_004748 [Tetrahymena malaccensis]
MNTTPKIEANNLENLNSSISSSYSYTQDEISQYQEELNSMDADQIFELYAKIAKSNEIKNILNQFENFINSSGDQIVIESISETIHNIDISKVRKEFNTFCKIKQHNQSFLVSVMKSKRYSSLFQYFLNYYIIDWILNTNVKHIKTHLICIVFYLKCFQDHSLIDKIKTYKKKR